MAGHPRQSTDGLRSWPFVPSRPSVLATMRDSARALFTTNRPLLHSGRSCTLGIHGDLGRFLDETVRSGQVTLETGSGLSTMVLLAARVAHHIAVTPAADEVAAILGACAERGIPVDPLEPVLEPSQ